MHLQNKRNLKSPLSKLYDISLAMFFKGKHALIFTSVSRKFGEAILWILSFVLSIALLNCSSSWVRRFGSTRTKAHQPVAAYFSILLFRFCRKPVANFCQLQNAVLTHITYTPYSRYLVDLKIHILSRAPVVYNSIQVVDDILIVCLSHTS